MRPPWVGLPLADAFIHPRPRCSLAPVLEGRAEAAQAGRGSTLRQPKDSPGKVLRGCFSPSVGQEGCCSLPGAGRGVSGVG